MRRRCTALLTALALSAGLSGCGGSDQQSLTIYSGREEEIVAPLLKQFSEATGIELKVRYGDSAELAATIAEEGDNSPADVFFAQDAGSLGSIDERLATLPEGLLQRVDARYRDPAGKWVGTSGRVRVIAYNSDELSESQLPDSVFELTAPRWHGKVGVAPTNASFQAFVTTMRLTQGEEKTRAWLEAMRANDVRFYEKNLPIVEAIASGEIELGLVNHYYLYVLKEEQPGAPVANHFLAPGDPGTLVNVAGVGILASSDNEETAQRFVRYLLSNEGQHFYADKAEEAEYPLVAGIGPRAGLPALDDLKGPKIPLGDLGPELERTLKLLSETGYLS